MKKTVTLLSTFAIFSVLSMNLVSAAGQDGEIVKAWRTTEKGMVELNRTELTALKARHKNHQQTDQTKADAKENIRKQGASSFNPLTISPESYTITTYKESGRSWADEMWSQKYRMSDYVYNYTTNNASRAISYKASDTYTANYSLSITDKGALTSALGASWQSLYEYSDTVTVTIPPNTKSWMDWVPIKDNTFGYIYSDTYSDWSGLLISSERRWVDLYTARQINGKSDGISLLMEAKL